MAYVTDSVTPKVHLPATGTHEGPIDTALSQAQNPAAANALRTLPRLK